MPEPPLRAWPGPRGAIRRAANICRRVIRVLGRHEAPGTRDRQGPCLMELVCRGGLLWLWIKSLQTSGLIPQRSILSPPRRPEVRCHGVCRALPPPKARGRGASSPLPAPGLVAASIFTQLFLPLGVFLRTLVMGFRAHQMVQEDLLLRSLITPAKTLLPNKATIQGQDVDISF